MKDVANVVWFVLGGFVSVVFWGILGALFCATIIGIPLGKQLFKIAQFALHPFNDDVEMETNFAKYFIANLIWLLIGFLLMLFYALLGAALCITLIGVPFGKVYFKLAFLSVAPFGIEVEKKYEVIKEWEEWKNW